MRPLVRLASTLLRLGTRGLAARFRETLADPAAAQARVLAELLAHGQDSAYGKAHGFDRVRDARDWQARVPVVSYDDIAPWIERAMRGEQGVLSTDPVRMFEKTSGSSAAAKYVPYNALLLEQFGVALKVWLHDVYANRPALRGRTAYWSISPLARERERTPGGLPVGFEDDAAYFEGFAQPILGRLLPVPSAVAHVPDVATSRYVTLRHLLDGPGPGLISVWNPTFLTLLVRAAADEGDRLLHDLRAGTLSPPTPLPAELQARLARGLRRRGARAEALQARRGAWSGLDLFPELALISCWTDGAAARALPELRAMFPGVEIQGKGLLATEGVVSFPLLGLPGAVPALRSHFLEFQPLGAPQERPRLVHELDDGARYEVLISTGGGFYRYALGDVVEVVGRAGRVPLLAFRGKAALVSDLVGEKLAALHVGEALDAVGLGDRFAMLAPAWGDPPAYELFTAVGPDAASTLADEVDRLLRANPHYAYARDLGQLGPVRTVPVGPDAAERFLAGCIALGQRAGDVKPTPLHRETGWRERLVPHDG